MSKSPPRPFKSVPIWFPGACVLVLAFLINKLFDLAFAKDANSNVVGIMAGLLVLFIVCVWGLASNASLSEAIPLVNVILTRVNEFGERFWGGQSKLPEPKESDDEPKDS